MASKSFRDPAYAALARANEQKFGLPDGLLVDIITKGERSNSDQVSEAGARTVFQVIPATRRAALKKWGVDAYLSDENAAEVAARLLKESLDRNRGDKRAAVAEYHGGTNRDNWGPRTRAYVGRVVGSGGDDTLRGGGGRQSTFDRAKAAREQETGPSIAKVYEAYKTGQMTPEEAKAFEADVNTGHLMLPAGARLKTKPQAAVLPPAVLAAYNSQSEMTDAERAQLDADLAEGIVTLPKGAALHRPAPRTVGDYAGMTGRAAMRGLGGAADFVTGALPMVNPMVAPLLDVGNAALKGAGLPETATGGADQVADALNLATPGTPGEKLAMSLVEGAAPAVVTGPVGGLRGMAGRLLVDATTGAAGAGAAEAVRQQGGGAGSQFAASMLGGLGVAASLGGARRVAQAFGPKAAKVVETVPREAVLDEAGALTEEGREVASRAGLKPDELRGAYDEAAKPDPVEEGPAPARPPAEAPEPTFVERNATPPEAPPTYRDFPDDEAVDMRSAPGTAAGRFEEGADVGVRLSKAQAEKDFDAQAREETLKAEATPEGNDARTFFAKQAEDIKGAVERFRATLGDPAMNATERGQVVKDALRDLRDSGKAGVSALYNQARTLAEGLGAEGKNLINLDTAPLLARMRELFIDEGVPEGTRKALKQQAAKYGLIGENPRTVEGETTVQLRDSTGEPSGRMTFTGPPQTLSVTNAEDLRKAINGLFEPGKTNPQEALKSVLDDAVEAAVDRAASSGPGEVGQAFRTAREAHKTQQATFKAGDVVEKVIAWKKGQRDTEAINPEDIFRTIFAGGPEGLTNLRKLKAVLLNKPTEASKGAWKAIQAHGVADIFKQALSPDDTVSGLKLNSAIKKFGPDKLKVLLDESDFNQLMKLRRVIGDATIPLPRTTNPSGSGYVIVRLAAKLAQNLAPLGRTIPMVRDVVKGAEEFGAAKAAKKTAEGVTNYTPANADAPAKSKTSPAAFVRKFVDLASSDRIITPLLAAANEDRP